MKARGRTWKEESPKMDLARTTTKAKSGLPALLPRPNVKSISLLHYHHLLHTYLRVVDFKTFTYSVIKYSRHLQVIIHEHAHDFEQLVKSRLSQTSGAQIYETFVNIARSFPNYASSRA